MLGDILMIPIALAFRSWANADAHVGQGDRDRIAE